MLAAGTQQAQAFRWGRGPQDKLDYLLFLPVGYAEGTGEDWPLVLFLHGAGERGRHLESVKRHGLPKELERQRDFPAIVVSPQCPPRASWSITVLATLLDEVQGAFAVDHNRIYITGMSMGGYGTWALATAYPERFAAIAPVCGGGDPLLACAIKHVPVWAFHGAKDDVVPVQATMDVVNALKSCGGDVRVTIYPDLGHDSWTPTYANPDLYAWLFSQRRRQEGVDAAG